MDIWTIANWFLNREAMEHSKLEGMVYLSYAWFYALHQRELFSTSGFEALPVYIVEPRLFERYKNSGKKKLRAVETSMVSDELGAFLESVYQIYGFADGDVLSGYLRKSEPYQLARKRQPDFKIHLTDIFNYYERQVQKK